MSNSDQPSKPSATLPSDEASIAARAERAAMLQTEPLNPVEVRVLGCLLEKESTTPDNYPLTLNSLRLACNQTTIRDPIVDLDEHTIEQALVALRTRGLTRTVHSTSNRAAKFRHVLPEAIGVAPDEVAVLAVLMLRGPQTIGEIKGRTGRLYDFASTDAVGETLTELARRGLVLQLPRQPGHKDARWVHLLSGPVDVEALTSPSSNGRSAVSASSAGAPAPTYEFEAAFLQAAWDDWMSDAVRAFDGIDLTAGPIVNVSAGVGVSLDRFMRLVPGSSIVAVEPVATRRTALLARLASHPEWSVTVEPVPLAQAQLPPHAAAVIALDLLTSGSPADIDRLWDYIASSLEPGGAALVATAPGVFPARVRVAGLDIERVDDRYLVRRVSQADDLGAPLLDLPAPPRRPPADADAAQRAAESRGLSVTRLGSFLLVTHH